LLGYVSPTEWVYLQTGSSDAEVERFRAGDLTYLGIPPNYQTEFRDDPNYQIYEQTAFGFSYLAFNLANPDNPLPGLDEDGNPVEQDPHPIFGDQRVRLALAYMTDTEAIVEGIYEGAGVPIGTHTVATSYFFRDDLSRDYDPDLGVSMLEEAGWVLEDGSECRVCRNCAYTAVDPDYEGSEMRFNITANEGNDVRERYAQFVSAEWNDLGVCSEYGTLEWGSAFIPALVGQTFDVVTLGWTGLGEDNGDMTWAYGPEADLPGGGFNFVSFSNERFNELQAMQRDPAQTNGCDLETRKPMVQEAMEILFNEVPYIYLVNNNIMLAAQAEVEGFDPRPYSNFWNIDSWRGMAQGE
jgi:peptide/nickel transport system substrate-binding protein